MASVSICKVRRSRTRGNTAPVRYPVVERAGPLPSDADSVQLDDARLEADRDEMAAGVESAAQLPGRSTRPAHPSESGRATTATAVPASGSFCVIAHSHLASPPSAPRRQIFICLSRETVTK